MIRVEIDDIDLGLNLAYSYLLPLFVVNTSDHEVRIKKIYGDCSGLECFVKDAGAVCYVPDTCSEETYRYVTGLEKKTIVDEMISYFDLHRLSNIFHRFAPLYSPGDSLFIAISIYLSRNTDYYLNTIRWVRDILEKRCYIELSNCIDSFNSFQYKELLNSINFIYEATREKDPFVATSNLIKVRGFGVKSAMAYLLHAHGLTSYAPIDRYYLSFLKEIGFRALIPSKKQCLENVFVCSTCRYGGKCLYKLVQDRLGKFNGLIQSMVYIYGRLVKPQHRRGDLENILLSRLRQDLFVSGINRLIEVLREDGG